MPEGNYILHSISEYELNYIDKEDSVALKTKNSYAIDDKSIKCDEEE